MSPPMSRPNPWFCQIQDNGNDLEEEGGDDFVDIDDMLLDELDLSGLLGRLATTATAATAATTVTTTATARPLQRPGRLLRRRLRLNHEGVPPEGLKGQRVQEEEQKATGGGDTTATGS